MLGTKEPRQGHSCKCLLRVWQGAVAEQNQRLRAEEGALDSSEEEVEEEIDEKDKDFYFSDDHE